MIREAASIACAKTILEPFIKSGMAKPDVVPMVAMMIQMSVKRDELDQQLAILNPERCRREGMI